MRAILLIFTCVLVNFYYLFVQLDKSYWIHSIVWSSRKAPELYHADPWFEPDILPFFTIFYVWLAFATECITGTGTMPSCVFPATYQGMRTFLAVLRLRILSNQPQMTSIVFKQS